MLIAQQLVDVGRQPLTSSAAKVDRAVDTASWYALSTLPRNEKSVAKALENYGLEAFLPTYDAVRLWKNRQRTTVRLPLFVGYVFTRLRMEERFRAIAVAGAVRFVGTSKGPVPIPTIEIDFLRSRYCTQQFEPFQDLLIGQRVRIWRGVMEGVEGVLVRKNNDVRFVLTIKLINQHIATVVDAADLEPI